MSRPDRLAGALSDRYLAWRDARNAQLTMATHDTVLGTAARALGLQVVGV